MRSTLGNAAISLAMLAISGQALAQQSLPFDPRTGAPLTLPQDATLPLPVGGDGQGQVSVPEINGRIAGPRAIIDPGNQLTAQQLLTASPPVPQLLKPPPAAGEFEKYVERLLGRALPRYGADLLVPSNRDFAQPATATVPPSYVVRPGDTITISLSGSMEGSVQRTVDANGRIYLQGVGTIRVAGVRHADLRDTLSAAIGTQYRGFSVSVRLESLRGIRVFVTGFANNPGAFTVNSLSTMANAALQAGGPSSGGSFRSLKLYRNGRELGDFDLYELLRGGNRIHDLIVENEDVLFLPPAGPQVAVFGSVQDEAIYEALPGETVEQMLAAAGGPNTLGDATRVILYRNNGNGPPGPRELSRHEAAVTQVAPGDIIHVVSTGSLIQPVDQQSVLVRVEGEVMRPGVYHVPPQASLDDVLAQAGGLAPGSFLFGTRLTRSSVKLQQRDGYRDAIQQLELMLAAAPLTNDSSQDAVRWQSQLLGARAVLDKLKQTEPDGRIVLPITINAAGLPGAIRMENNDEIYVPARPSTVGVFGAVYRPASFLVERKPQRVSDYIEQAGGTIRAADKSGIFVVRANGEVLSRKRGALGAQIYPGDVIFVPVKTQGSTFWAKVKDITQTLFQLSLSAATVFTVTK